MTASREGVQRVDVRSKWPNEAYDFTPWLAGHLDLLGAELGLTLEEVGQEVAVGPYFLDILAKAPGEDGGDVRVAIENQLEWSDLHHLGQLLTYATGRDARVAVWVAPEFRRQLAEALHRLNEWTRDGISFYAVKVEVVRRDGSEELEPRLHKVVWPGGWDEDSTAPDGAQSEESRLYDGLLPAADRRTHADGLRRRCSAALRPYRPILHPRDRGAHRLRGIPRGTERRLGHVPHPHGRHRANQPHLRRTPCRPRGDRGGVRRTRGGPRAG